MNNGKISFQPKLSLPLTSASNPTFRDRSLNQGYILLEKGLPLALNVGLEGRSVDEELDQAHVKGLVVSVYFLVVSTSGVRTLREVDRVLPHPVHQGSEDLDQVALEADVMLRHFGPREGDKVDAEIFEEFRTLCDLLSEWGFGLPFILLVGSLLVGLGEDGELHCRADLLLFYPAKLVL